MAVQTTLSSMPPSILGSACSNICMQPKMYVTGSLYNWKKNCISSSFYDLVFGSLSDMSGIRAFQNTGRKRAIKVILGKSTARKREREKMKRQIQRSEWP